MVPWSIYILTFLYNFTFGALVGESPRAGAILHGARGTIAPKAPKSKDFIFEEKEAET